MEAYIKKEWGLYYYWKNKQKRNLANRKKLPDCGLEKIYRKKEEKSSMSISQLFILVN